MEIAATEARRRPKCVELEEMEGAEGRLRMCAELEEMDLRSRKWSLTVLGGNSRTPLDRFRFIRDRWIEFRSIAPTVSSAAKSGKGNGNGVLLDNRGKRAEAGGCANA
jgi:hypothetical protein